MKASKFYTSTPPKSLDRRQTQEKTGNPAIVNALADALFRARKH